MQGIKRVLTSGAAVAALGISVFAAPTAQAAPVTIGSDLARMSTVNTNCNNPCTTTNATLPANQQAAGGLTSPVDGIVTSWQARGSSNAELRVLTPGTTLQYTGGAASAPQTLSQTLTPFATNIPIKAGDVVGLNILMGSLSMVNNAGATQAYFQPTLLGAGATETFQAGGNLEVAVQATIQPKPVATLTVAKAKQKLKKAAVSISSTENVKATITATVKGAKGSVTQPADLSAGVPVAVSLGFKGKFKKKIQKAIRRKGPRKVAVTAVATDNLGQSAAPVTATFKVK